MAYEDFADLAGRSCCDGLAGQVWVTNLPRDHDEAVSGLISPRNICMADKLGGTWVSSLSFESRSGHIKGNEKEQ